MSPLPSVTFRSELPPIVRKELDQFDGELTAYLLKEHDDDGRHAHITAQSLTIKGTPITGGVGPHAATHQPGGSHPMAVDAPASSGSLRTLGPGSTQAAPGNDARFTNARPPTAHATTHQPGGADPMAVDAAAATGSLRTLGSGANQAAAGNDTRFTNARTPTAHAPTHMSGGTDAIKLDELAAPTDVTTLNATTGAHGLLRKLPNVATAFLDGQGNWTPIGAWTGYTPTIATDAGSATGGTRDGQYTLLGPRTMVAGFIVTSLTIAGSPGEVRVGLPFTVASPVGLRISMPVNYFNGTGWISALGQAVSGENFVRVTAAYVNGTGHVWGTVTVPI